MSSIAYPNESSEYRKARNALLDAELELRSQIERVAAQRRQLPLGGLVKEDYAFEEWSDGQVQQVRLSELFGDKDTLFLYSFMYSPDMTSACPMCTSLLDGLDGQALHINQRISSAVVAKHSIDQIHRHADSRRWSNLRLLSSRNNGYNADYFGEVDEKQITNANVFVKDETGNVRHFWGAEMTMAPMIAGGNMRHLDLVWPVWNVLDLTPSGRGQWYPTLSYE